MVERRRRLSIGRFDHSPGRYVLSTGEAIAESWEDLTDGELLHPINRTMNGALEDEVPIWSPTQEDGPLRRRSLRQLDVQR